MNVVIAYVYIEHRAVQQPMGVFVAKWCRGRLEPGKPDVTFTHSLADAERFTEEDAVALAVVLVGRIGPSGSVIGNASVESLERLW